MPLKNFESNKKINSFIEQRFNELLLLNLAPLLWNCLEEPVKQMNASITWENEKCYEGKQT